MGGWVGDVFDGAADIVSGGVDAISDAVSDIGGALQDAYDDTVDFAADAAKFYVNSIMTVTGAKWLDEQITGGLVYNTYIGIIDNVADLNHGLINGDWTQIRDSSLGLLTTAVAIVAIAIGAFLTAFGIPIGPWMMAAGFIVLDAQYNEGRTLGKVIDLAAGVETAVLNTHYIETYAVEIQMAITIAATMYAGYVAGPFIVNFTGIGALAQQWAFQINIVQAGYGGYQTYMAIQSIIDSQEYWKAKLDEYMAALNKWMAEAQAARAQWFDMMTNTDLINRIQAGGDMFSMGAGHDLWSMTSVAEPMYALGIINKSDSQMDNLINNRYYGQKAGNDGFRVN